MSRPGDPLRLLLALLLGVAVLALLHFGLGLAERTLSLWQALSEGPALLRWTLLAALAALGAGSAWLLWRLFARPATGARRPERIDRGALESRLQTLQAQGAKVAPLRVELETLDQRRASGRLQLALFGDISTGKSSLLRALLPNAAVEIDARGGSTREVSQHAGETAGFALDIADVPGVCGADGETLAASARAEAARAHALLYVCEGDLSRSQDTDLRALARFGRPLLLVLNKIDRYDEGERRALLETLRQRYAGLGAEVLAVCAGHVERLRRIAPDGREDWVQRERPPELDELLHALRRIAALGAQALEPAREAATLSALEQQLDAAERTTRERLASDIVQRYTRRALVAALATVAPGTDLVIQGGLATAMLRELAGVHGRSLRELDIDAFVRAASGRVRGRSALVLAIAGNAMKAFPGLGTLGGGLVHALAYGLIFDALGRAAAEALAAGEALDRDETLRRFEDSLAAPRAEQLQRLARLALESLPGSRSGTREGAA